MLKSTSIAETNLKKAACEVEKLKDELELCKTRKTTLEASTERVTFMETVQEPFAFKAKTQWVSIDASNCCSVS
jgi:hypothetical protein